MPTLRQPELFFGLCSAVGTDNKKTIDILKKLLANLGYSCEITKVTKLMKQIVIPHQTILETPLELRYDTHIKYANKIRELYDRKDILAIICASAVGRIRKQKGKGKGEYVEATAFIFDQFKRPEEIEILRQIYGHLFISISVYSDKEARTKAIADLIAADHSESRTNTERGAAARNLVARDEDEEGIPNGQRLRDAFPLADVFIDIDDPVAAEMVLKRFLESFFGSNRISPTRDEAALYFAKGASLISLDLSRQVGAAVYSEDGQLITLGYNEVPKAHGGVYTEATGNDDRDHVIGRDENERIKRALLADVVAKLLKSELITTSKDKDELVDAVIQEAMIKGSALRDALLMDLLEFGRVIHAEMHAISDAARRGLSLQGAIMYCTTFPCHICAKHIIAAGISKVIFVEPYPKSYAQELYKSIVVKAGDCDKTKVQFAPFIGIAPTKFRELFYRKKRKDEKGVFQEYIGGLGPHPIIKYTFPTYLLNETRAVKIFDAKSKALQASHSLQIKIKV